MRGAGVSFAVFNVKRSFIIIAIIAKVKLYVVIFANFAKCTKITPAFGEGVQIGISTFVRRSVLSSFTPLSIMNGRIIVNQSMEEKAVNLLQNIRGKIKYVSPTQEEQKVIDYCLENGYLCNFEASRNAHGQTVAQRLDSPALTQKGIRFLEGHR